MNIETLEDLFGYQLQHAYYAERTHVELLAELAADARDDVLGEQLTAHIEETESQIERLEAVFAALGRRPQASRSRSVDGLADARRLRRESPEDDPTGRDGLEIALLAERLEIRTYETLVTIAGRLAYAEDIVTPLETNLAEERAALQALEDLEAELSITATMEADSG